MAAPLPESERDLEVAASFTFQREGRLGEAALQQWRREVLKEEAKNVDLTQSVLFRSIQDWAHRHSSEERAAAKGRRVTIQGGQIVQGSQKNPPVRLAQAQRIPPYTFWTFAPRNFKPVNENDKLGLVYGEGGEATILPDTEDENAARGGEAPEEGPPAHVFSEVEDHQLWATCEKHGAGPPVLRTLARLLLHGNDEDDPSDEEEKLIAARYKWLQTAPPLRIKTHLTSESFGGAAVHALNPEATPEPGALGGDMQPMDEDTAMAGPGPDWEPSDLAMGLSTFNTIFCRRCYVHDCHLHGTKEKDDPCLDPLANQRPVIAPPSTGLEMMQPCSRTCYWSGGTGQGDSGAARRQGAGGATGSGEPIRGVEVLGTGGNEAVECSGRTDAKRPGPGKQFGDTCGDAQSNTTQPEERADEGIPPAVPPPGEEAGPPPAARDPDGWTPYQVGLLEAGVRMYGRHNSACRIARLLRPLRTCAEVAHRLKRLKASGEDAEGGAAAADANAEAPEKKERRKRANHNNKVTVLHKLARKRNAAKLRQEGDLQGRLKLAAYTPCACADGCDDGPDSQCPCARAFTPCEKYCACASDCHLKDGLGCRCTSSCSRSNCPCLAAGRECDPDLCHGCMVSCGHSPGEPLSLAAIVPDPNLHQRGALNARLDRCQNMRLQQRRHKKILLGPSEVAGWGAFVCGGAQAGELLGEYTGELVTDAEAEQRGRVYDANNKSFLFQLNDQFILDACHKGDKLKFANHSPNPNCRPKVVSVLGDHRVAIHVERNLESGEEIFYDYNYTENQAPDWALTEADRKRREHEMQEIRKVTKKGTRK